MLIQWAKGQILEAVKSRKMGALYVDIVHGKESIQEPNWEEIKIEQSKNTGAQDLEVDKRGIPRRNQEVWIPHEATELKI